MWIRYNSLKGKYEIEAEFFTDDTFAAVSTASDMKILGETLYLGLTPKTPLSDEVSFYLSSCTSNLNLKDWRLLLFMIFLVSDHASKNVTIIEDSCPIDMGLDTTISTFLADETIGISYKAFDFGATVRNKVLKFSFYKTFRMRRLGQCWLLTAPSWSVSNRNAQLSQSTLAKN